MTTSAELRRAARRLIADDAGQSTTEYILVIGLISIPIWVVFKALLTRFFVRYIKHIVNHFTRG